jgi:hypothetical protein
MSEGSQAEKSESKSSEKAQSHSEVNQGKFQMLAPPHVFNSISSPI